MFYNKLYCLFAFKNKNLLEVFHFENWSTIINYTFYKLTNCTSMFELNNMKKLKYIKSQNTLIFLFFPSF